MSKPPMYQLDNVYCEDSIDAVKNIPDDSIHLIASDIPYGIGVDEWDVLHNNTNSAYLGKSPAQEKAGAIFKSRGKPINGWSEADREIPKQYYEWCSLWASEWLRILKPGASAFVFAGRRFSHRCICALEDAGFSFKDMLAWKKQKAPHRAQRLSVIYNKRGDIESDQKWRGWRVGNLRPTFEPILWFVKPYKIGATIADNVLNHEVGAYNDTAFSQYVEKVENVIGCGFEPGETGFHDTQKPIKLMKALVELVTTEAQVVLDPFCGSGSTLVAAKELNRSYIGFDIKSDFVNIAKHRLELISSNHKKITQQQTLFEL